MADRSDTRLAMVQETRFARGVDVRASRRPAVRRYRLVRMAPLAEPVAARLAQMRAIHEESS